VQFANCAEKVMKEHITNFGGLAEQAECSSSNIGGNESMISGVTAQDEYSGPIRVPTDVVRYWRIIDNIGK
jgi:hypothetical protein